MRSIQGTFRVNRTQHIYISATKQDAGKTTLMIGLLQILRDLGYDIGYIKPVGQRYVVFDGLNIDEDAVLARHVFSLTDHPSDMSPIAIERGFTERYIFNRDPKPLEDRITAAMGRLQAAHNMVLVEGTGHAGVGSCFDLSNARVAQLVGAAVVIVADGGIGRAIDEVALSLEMFKRHDVRVLGIILNRTWPENLARIQRSVDEGLKHLGTRLLGVIPFRPSLVQPRMQQIADEIGGRVLCGEAFLGNRVERTVIAAMAPEHVQLHLRSHTLMISAGDRTENILLAVVACTSKAAEMGPLSGLLLTGGFQPPGVVVTALKQAGIPVILCEEDTYTVASKLRSLQFKLRPEDTDKLDAAKTLIRESISVTSLMDVMEGKA